jgi:hypothetical protein
MSIKFYPLGNFPVSSSFSVTASFSENNLGALLTSESKFAEETAFSITPAPRGNPGRDIVIEAKEELIELSGSI